MHNNKTCSNCGQCVVNIDYDTEKVKRVCVVYSKPVNINDSCINHCPKMVSVSADNLCNAPTGTHFGTLQ